MQRRVLIILPVYKRASCYFNVLLKQMDSTTTSSTIQRSQLEFKNDKLDIRVINDSGVNGNLRGNRFHNILIHEDCHIEDDDYNIVLVPSVLVGDVSRKIQGFDDEMELYIIGYLLSLGQPEDIFETRRYNFLRDFVDTEDKK